MSLLQCATEGEGRRGLVRGLVHGEQTEEAKDKVGDAPHNTTQH
jgi:hypothetical protein